MATKILVRRGVVADLDQETLDEGELAFTTDELGLYVGSDAVTEGFIKVNKTGNIEYDGNALTSATDTNNLKEAVQNIDVALKTEQDLLDIAQEDIFELQGNFTTLTTNLNNHTHTIEELSNVAVSSASNGQVLKYLNGNWVNQEDSVESDNFYLTSVDASTISNVSFVQEGVASNVTADFTHTHTKSNITDFDHTHPISEVNNLQNALDAKAPTSSPTFTGVPVAPTPLATDNSTRIATTEFVKTAVTNLVDAAPAALDTLNELAAALGDDANFATTVTDSIATKVSQSAYDDHTHRTGRYFLGSVSSEDLPNAVNFTQLAGGFTILSSSIFLYRTTNPTNQSAAGNVGTLWLNIQTGGMFRLTTVAPPNGYVWESVGSILDWVNISALDPDTYYGFNGVYFAVQDGANLTQGTFLYVPNINAIQTTIDNDQGLYMIKYTYFDSVANTTINQTYVTHPTFIGWEDINDVYNIPGYNSGFVEISSQFLTGGVYNIAFPMPANANDIQQIYFYGISTVSVTETQYVF